MKVLGHHHHIFERDKTSHEASKGEKSLKLWDEKNGPKRKGENL